jgi:hypothetical protein
MLFFGRYPGVRSVLLTLAVAAPAGRAVPPLPKFNGTVNQSSKAECVSLAKDRKEIRRDLKIDECWKGFVNGRKFDAVTQYADGQGGLVTVRIAGRPASISFSTDASPDVYFTGSYLCHSMKAGAWFKAINLASGEYLADGKDDDTLALACSRLAHR